MVLRAPDANTDGSSSNSSDANGADSSQQEQDAQEQSQENEESSSETADSEESSANATGEEQEADAQENSQQEEQQEQEEAAQEENVVVDKEEDKKLPFHKHPRFQEVINEKNQFKQEVEKVKPLVDQATVLNDFMRDNQISPQEFQSALQYLQALRRDPVAAFKMLQPTYEQLAQFAGERLPAELQAEVSAGTLTLERAKQIARAEANERYQQVRQSWQQNGQQSAVGDVVGATKNLWVQTKQTIDPDLKAGSALWEQTDLRLRALEASTPPRNAQEAQHLCEKAYTEAKTFLKGLAPRQPVQRKNALQSRHSASGNNQVVKSAEDVARAISRGVKPHQLRYS